MARPEVRDRQFSLYFPSVEDKERWRKLAEPLTLNHWIMLMVEKAIEDKPEEMKTSDDLNVLRREVVELRRENQVMAAKLRMLEGLRERSNEPVPLDKNVIGLLKSGGAWSSGRINKELIVWRPNPDHLVNLGAENSERARSIRGTLEQLETLGLVKNTFKGWVWIK